jgi:hypothetical protein
VHPSAASWGAETVGERGSGGWYGMGAVGRMLEHANTVT